MKNHKKSRKEKKNLGRIVVDLGYIVDLNDSTMVENAKKCFYEDLMGLVKFNQVWDGFKIQKAKKAKIQDIPDFILPSMEE